MLRSMYAGISGMKNFQTKLDVIGNNIANVSTPGYKKGRVTFQEMMSQTTQAAQGATDTRGGVNAAQVGIGSQQGTIDNIHTQGFRQTTNNPLDLSIQGDGMFAVVESSLDTDEYNPDISTPASIDEEEANFYYTRSGNFYLDQDGNIVNSQGLYLVGFMHNNNEDGDTTMANIGTIHIPKNAQSFNVMSNGVVEYVDASGESQVAGQVAIANFSNSTGLIKAGNNLYINSNNAGGLDEDENGIVDLIAPESENSSSSIIGNSLEMSNVDLAEEFTEMISAQRGFQANTRIITTSDEILQELVNLKR